MIKKISFFFCFFITINLQSQIPTDGLVAHYPMDGTAIDITPNANNGVLNSGTSSTVDRFGVTNGALRLNGQLAFVNVANDSLFDFSIGITISIWVNPINAGFSNFTGLVNKWEDVPPNQGGGGKGYYLGFNNDGYKVRWNTGSIYAEGSSIPLNEWTHILVTNDSTFLKIYINGVLDKTSPAVNPMLPTDVDLRFGEQSEIFVGNYSYYGVMDEVLLYDRALTPDEVVQIYENDPTSVANKWLDSNIEIFPNPCQGFFQIKSEKIPSDFLQGEIYDTHGKLIKAFRINTFNQTVSTEGLENGFYVFLIRSEDGIIMREKLMKI